MSYAIVRTRILVGPPFVSRGKPVAPLERYVVENPGPDCEIIAGPFATAGEAQQEFLRLIGAESRDRHPTARPPLS